MQPMHLSVYAKQTTQNGIQTQDQQQTVTVLGFIRHATFVLLLTADHEHLSSHANVNEACTMYKQK